MTSKVKHPNNLLKLRKAAGLTQEDIARIWGVHRGDVSRIERGEHSITTTKRELLTKHFGWSASQILDAQEQANVAIFGDLVEGGAIQLSSAGKAGIRSALHDVFKLPENTEFVGAPPGEYGTQLACIRVVGNAMHPVYKDGDALFYQHRSHEESEYLGKDCVVLLKDKRLVVGSVKPGRSFDSVCIECYRQPAMEEISIVWAAPILWVKKGR